MGIGGGYSMLGRVKNISKREWGRILWRMILYQEVVYEEHFSMRERKKEQDDRLVKGTRIFKLLA